jgi:hypothetical protein
MDVNKRADRGLPGLSCRDALGRLNLVLFVEVWGVAPQPRCHLERQAIGNIHDALSDLVKDACPGAIDLQLIQSP